MFLCAYPDHRKGIIAIRTAAMFTAFQRPDHHPKWRVLEGGVPGE